MNPALLQTPVQRLSVSAGAGSCGAPLPVPSTVLTQHPGRGAMPLIRLAALGPLFASASEILHRLHSFESTPLSTQQLVSPRRPASPDYQLAASGAWALCTGQLAARAGEGRLGGKTEKEPGR